LTKSEDGAKLFSAAESQTRGQIGGNLGRASRRRSGITPFIGVDQEDRMKRLTHSIAHFLHSFLNACLLSLALTFFLVAANVAVMKGMTLFV